jgi:hypothetical protein
MEDIMSTSVGDKLIGESGIATRVLSEGYGPGAWHGADLKTAVADVTPAVAFWRPAAERHNIAEIALHHAYFARVVQAQLSGRPAEPFVLPGEEWFSVDDDATLAWPKIAATLESEQQRLSQLVNRIEAGTAMSPIGDGERFGLVLGITCHAIYHAGQIQLIKRLRGA